MPKKKEQKKRDEEATWLRHFYPDGTQFKLPTPVPNPYEDGAALVIPVESHLEDKIRYCMEDVPPYRGQSRPSPTIDEGQYFDYEFKRQLKTPGVTLDKLTPKEIVHVRSYDAAEQHLTPLLQIADKSPKPIFVGLDQEDKGATIQLAYRHNNDKKVIVLQM